MPGNVDFVMKARRDPEFKQLLQELDLIVADGVPITWAATLLRTPLRGRVSETDLVCVAARSPAKLRIPIALIGAAPGIAQRAADKILEGFPGAELHALPNSSPAHPKPKPRAGKGDTLAKCEDCSRGTRSPPTRGGSTKISRPPELNRHRRGFSV